MAYPLENAGSLFLRATKIAEKRAARFDELRRRDDAGIDAAGLEPHRRVGGRDRCDAVCVGSWRTRVASRSG